MIEARVALNRERFVTASGRPKVRLLLLVGMLSIFGPLCIDMYLPALPHISANLHASTSEIQLSLTTCLIGMGTGQLVFGPLSDRHGRRRPLAWGLLLFITASIVCAFAPSAPILALLRFAQGFGGAGGIVISRAVVRDLFDGSAAARVFSMLFLVVGAGPILAPQIGAELLNLTSWQGVFLVLGLIGTALLITALFRLPETLAPELRNSAGITATFRSMRRVAVSRTFWQNAAPCSLSFGAIFAYVAGSSFILENIYGLSPQRFGLVFSSIVCGLIAMSQVNGRIVNRLGPTRLLTRGLILLATATVVLFVVVEVKRGGLLAIYACLFCCVAPNGLVGPNATALALQDFPDAAGAAAALLGLVQFGVGAAVAPLVGIGGNHDAFPMAFTMASLGIGAVTVRVLLAHGIATTRAPGFVSELDEAIEAG